MALEDPGSDVGAPEHRCYRRPPGEEEKPRAGIETGKARLWPRRAFLSKAAPVRRNWNRGGGIRVTAGGAFRVALASTRVRPPPTASLLARQSL